jgi:hypothetical protein
MEPTRADEIRGRLLGALMRTWPLIGEHIALMAGSVEQALQLFLTLSNLPGPLRKLLPLPEQLQRVVEALCSRPETVRASLEALQYLQKSGQASSVDPGVLGQLLDLIDDDFLVNYADALAEQLRKVGPVALWVITGELPASPPPALSSTTDGPS